MTLRVKLYLLSILAVPAAILGLVIGISLDARPPDDRDLYLEWHAPPPKQNGYHRFIHAARLLDGQKDKLQAVQELSSANVQAARKLVAAYEETMEEAHAAALMPYFANPEPLDPNYYPNGARELALLFATKAQLSLRDGKTGQALGTGLDLVRLGSRIGESGTMRNWTIAYIYRKIGLDMLEKALTAGTPPDWAGCDEADRARLADCRTGYARAVRLDYTRWKKTFSQVASGQADFLDGYPRYLARFGLFFKLNSTCREMAEYQRARIERMNGSTRSQPNMRRWPPRLLEGNYYGQIMLALAYSKVDESVTIKNTRELEQRLKDALAAAYGGSRRREVQSDQENEGRSETAPAPR